MQLDEEGVEDLVVQAFQLKLLRGRLDQGNERIATTYAITRQFGEQEWIDLKEKVRLVRICIFVNIPQKFSKIHFSGTTKTREKNLRCRVDRKKTCLFLLLQIIFQLDIWQSNLESVRVSIDEVAGIDLLA